MQEFKQCILVCVMCDQASQQFHGNVGLERGQAGPDYSTSSQVIHQQFPPGDISGQPRDVARSSSHIASLSQTAKLGEARLNKAKCRYFADTCLAWQGGTFNLF